MKTTWGAPLLALGLAACAGEGDWVVETWGEEYIEDQIPAAVFADGCSVDYAEFLVVFASGALVDGDGARVAELQAGVFDLTVPGPTGVATLRVPADHYDTVELVVGPADGAPAVSATEAQAAAVHEAGASVLADGTLTCGGETAHFRWAFGPSTTYVCAPPDLTVPAGGGDDTQLTIHGDHLFYDGLEDPDAAVRGLPLLDADTDADGELAPEELQAVSIPSLGYTVGEFAEVLDLWQFVEHLSRTLAHVDGEGECRIDL